MKKIKENYSKHDIEMIRKLNTTDNGIIINDSTKRTLYNSISNPSENEITILIPLLFGFNTNIENYPNLNQIKTGIKPMDYLKLIPHKEIDIFITNTLKNLNDEQLTNLIEQLLERDLIPYYLIKKFVSSNNYLDTQTKTTKDYKDSHGWVLHQTRTLDRMISILKNGFQNGSSFENLVHGGGSNGDEDEFSFGYNIDKYDGSVGYGSFFLIFKTNFIELHHKKDQEDQVIFNINKQKNIFPIAYDKEYYYLSSNSGKILYRSKELKDVAQWIDTNYAQYRKNLDFKKDDIRPTDRRAAMMGGFQKSNGEKKYDAIETTFKQILKGMYLN